MTPRRFAEEEGAEAAGASEAPPGHAAYLAACAAVLARVAMADGQLALRESELIQPLLQHMDALSEPDVRRIAAIALGEARSLGDEPGRHAALLLGRIATRSQRIGLLRCAFAVAGVHAGSSPLELETLCEIGRELRLRADEILACATR